MLNFLFGVLCAGGAVFGVLLTVDGVVSETYEAVTAGGVFVFGSLMTFGLGQLTRTRNRKTKRVVRVPTAHSPEAAPPEGRTEPALFPESGQSAVIPLAARGEPEPEPPNPGLERVASRFARSDQ